MLQGSSQADALTLARQHAEAGRFDDFLTLCRQVAESHRDDLTAQLDLGGLLSSYGFLSEARNCYKNAQALAPDDLRATVNLANVLRDSGDHAASRHLYTDLLAPPK
jgi:Flp pilus assembly protein TadD